MIEHRAYPKIALTLDAAGVGDAHWVATEKIHGAQFVIGVTTEEVAFGKRKAWLADDEPFFGWQALRRELEQGARALAEALARPGTIYLYGELFGGAYPSASDEVLPGSTAVQTGIWYAPTLHFSLFDALVVELREGSEASERFVAHRELEDAAESAGLMTVPVLARGTRSELMRLPLRFDSRVPARFGLPPLPGNVAEGLVIKPDVELDAERRAIVKRKIPEFSELQFDESQPFDANLHLALPELLRWADRMINAVRIASARSKVGEQHDAIADEALLDVWIDLEAMFPRRMRALLADEDTALREGLAERIARLL